jgi:hypothetical protein
MGDFYTFFPWWKIFISRTSFSFQESDVFLCRVDGGYGWNTWKSNQKRAPGGEGSCFLGGWFLSPIV